MFVNTSVICWAKLSHLGLRNYLGVGKGIGMKGLSTTLTSFKEEGVWPFVNDQ